jgi:kumamolisin
MAEERVELSGSHRQPVPGARIGRRVDPAKRITVLVEVRRKAQPPKAPAHNRIINRKQLADQYGAHPDDLARVRAFAREHNLHVVAESAEKRTVELAGTVADMSAAFGVTLHEARAQGLTFRHRRGPVTLPRSVAPAVVAVLGLDDRPQAEPRYKSRPGGIARPNTAGALTPIEVANLYGFPAGDGTGKTIAIVELGGGFSQTDLNTYFSGLGVSSPSVTAVSVLGGSNNPGVDLHADSEVMLDIEVAGAVAPKANQRIYFAPNTDAGFLGAVKAAVHDSTTPVAISISWGSAESKWTASAMTAMESAFQDAANLGIPVTVASGDDGSFDKTGGLAADFPASAPHALGCGGTRLQGSGSSITSETVWNSGATDGATGGGVSDFFSKPTYQSGVSVPPPGGGGAGGRGVPDVCGNAAAESPYKVRISGADTESWGTSAVAPLWAGLIARLGQKLGKPVGFLNTLIYQSPTNTNAFRDITSGNNDISGGGGKYSAGPGWDPCTGLGSPKGSGLLTALQGAAPPGPSPSPPSPPGPSPSPPSPPKPPSPPGPSPSPPSPPKPPSPPGPSPSPPSPPKPPSPPGPSPSPPSPPKPPSPPGPSPSPPSPPKPPSPPGPSPSPPSPPTPAPSPPGTGGTGVTSQAFPAWMPPPYPPYPVPPPPAPAPPPIPPAYTEVSRRAAALLKRSPALGIVGVVGLVVLGVVGVVALSEDGVVPPREE